jgi:hypothetical protein
MILATCQAVLMAAVGFALLFPPGGGSARRAAIPLSAITGATDPEKRVAGLAYTQSKNILVLLRHAGRQVGLDNANGSWQGGIIG